MRPHTNRCTMTVVNPTSQSDASAGGEEVLYKEEMDSRPQPLPVVKCEELAAADLNSVKGDQTMDGGFVTSPPRNERSPEFDTAFKGHREPPRQGHKGPRLD